MSEQFNEEAIMIYDQTKELVIKDEDDYEYAHTLGTALSDHIKKVVKHYEPLKKAAYAAHKTITGQEKEDLEKPEAAKKILKKAMIGYEDAQEKIRLEAERVANEKIREEEEKKRKAREEEEARLIQESKDKGETYVPPAPAQPFEEYVPEVKVASSVTKRGQTRDNWKGEVKDMEAFVASVLKSGRLELIQINQGALNKYAAQMKTQAKIPGVVFFNDKIKVM